MTLAELLKDYFADHGQPGAPVIANPRVVIVGEIHGDASRSYKAASARQSVSVQLAQDLLHGARYRFFGSESFLNAGPVRHSLRDYWREGEPPPAFNPEDRDREHREEHAASFYVNAFQPILDDLRGAPRYILSLGSRTTGARRDRRIAQHFFEAMADRGATPQTSGVLLLLGAAHAAAKPYHKGQTTTRMYLEQNGWSCVSILALTNYSSDQGADDQLAPPHTNIHLTQLIGKSRVSVFTRHPQRNSQPSPFYSTRIRLSESGNTLAEQFEFLMLARITLERE